jgi:hypothetical protein
MGKVKPNISELSRRLGYADDSSINKRVNRLRLDGFLTDSGDAIELTRKGRRRIAFLIVPRYALLAIAALDFGYVWWSIMALLSLSPIHPEYMLAMGILSVVLLTLLWWAYRIGERQFCQIGRPDQEGRDQTLQQ